MLIALRCVTDVASSSPARKQRTTGQAEMTSNDARVGPQPRSGDISVAQRVSAGVPVAFRRAPSRGAATFGSGLCRRSAAQHVSCGRQRSRRSRAGLRRCRRSAAIRNRRHFVSFEASSQDSRRVENAGEVGPGRHSRVALHDASSRPPAQPDPSLTLGMTRFGSVLS
jgi:hypothetical protein